MAENTIPNRKERILQLMTDIKLPIIHMLLGAFIFAFWTASLTTDCYCWNSFIISYGIGYLMLVLFLCILSFMFIYLFTKKLN
ncbi:MAG: hypothetical protein CVU81_03265 [Euryarchaeota archaeon HGW-Euryarchaeota-1]|nr:MAG: hypothetical protein CVU81_03265 [Euryarchaeota archaeon HGW-Euryarchaeota-1]